MLNLGYTKGNPVKNIVFIPSSKEVEDYVPHPKPGKAYIPQDYKDLRNDTFKDLKFDETGKLIYKSLKTCVPFFDAFVNGYVQETWTDIYIDKKDEDYCEYHWPTGPKIMSSRDRMHRKINKNYYQKEFIWLQPWKIKLPDGYSCLITHPLNRDDLPFYTLSGIIDSDTYFHASFGNLPFYLDKSFSGIIPAGTPMFQIIPFKRDAWKTEVRTYNDQEQNKLSNEVLKHYVGAYKNKFWNKKIFE